MPFRNVEDARRYQREYVARRLQEPEYRARLLEKKRQAQRDRPHLHRAGNARHAAKRLEMLAQIKMARGCIDCGYREAPEALHFDHRDPAVKSFNISVNKTRAWVSVLAEIEKCDVRCANCHAVRTVRERHNRRRCAA